MDDKHAVVIYKLLNSAPRWHTKAGKLKHCADLLFKAYVAARQLSPEEQSETQDAEIADVATLLYGMAMENALKAVLLKEGIANVGADNKVNWNVDGANQHDLLEMCRSLKCISLTADQENLMKRLSAFVCWAGKYPTPLDIKRKKDYQGFLLPNQPNTFCETLPVPFEIEDKNMFNVIYKALGGRI